MASKIRIGLIFGGRSGEHEVSIRSARSVYQALDPNKYDVTLIGITKSGRWLTGGDTVAALTGGDDNTMIALADQSTDTEATLLGNPRQHNLMQLQPQAQSGAMHISNMTELDVIFPVLHGTYGEDGTMQGLFELANVPYVGAGVVGSAAGMDKGIFKAIMQGAGIDTLPYRVFNRTTIENDIDAVIASTLEALELPVFIKPCNLGSSVGISKANTIEALRDGLQEAIRWDRRILVEQGIDARELEVSVLGNDQPTASVVGEVRPKREFYDYVAKYISDDSELLIPAPLDESLAEHVRQTAVNVFRAIDCSGLARVDFLLDRHDNRLYINEVNTMPGFTSISMYPKLWEASGLSYPDLIDKLVALALERQADRDRTERSLPAQNSESDNG